MDTLFGDATSARPTPIARSETGSLLGTNSPMPGPSNIGPSDAIPGLDLDPPHVVIKNGKPQYSQAGGVQEQEEEEEVEENKGAGGWISRLLGRNGSDGGNGKNGKYRVLGQEEEG